MLQQRRLHISPQVSLTIWLIAILASALIPRMILGYNAEQYVSNLTLVSFFTPLLFINTKKLIFTKLSKIQNGKLFTSFLFIFTYSVTISLLNTDSITRPLVLFTMTILSFYFAHNFTVNICKINIYNALTNYGIISSILILIYSHFELYTVQNRLGEYFNPNAIGMICFSIILTGFLPVKRHLSTRILIILPAAYVLFLTNSRTSIIATLLSIALITIKHTKPPTFRTTSILFFFCFACTIYFSIYPDSAFDLTNQVFAIDDSDRGLDSGATNRSGAWEATFQIFLDNPMVGVGYRMHEHYLQSYSSSHNGPLALIAELGIFGVLTLCFIAASGYNLMLTYVRNEDNWMFPYFFGYILITLFERYLFNVGNPTSLIFILFFIVGISKQK